MVTESSPSDSATGSVKNHHYLTNNLKQLLSMEEYHYYYPMEQCRGQEPVYYDPSHLHTDNAASTALSDHETQDLSDILHAMEEDDRTNFHRHTIIQHTNNGYIGVSHNKSDQVRECHIFN